MKFLAMLIAGIWIIIPFSLRSQTSKEYRLKKGEVPMEVIPVKETYRFPEFRPGSVRFYSGKEIAAKLNYNLLYREIHFLNEKGDTLALQQEPFFKLVKIGEETFYFMPDEGFLELVSIYPSIKLGRKQSLEPYKPDPVDRGWGSYAPSAVSNGNSAGDVSRDAYKYQVSYKEYYSREVPQNIKIAEKNSFFFIDKNNHLHPAKKRNILSFFPKYRRTIKRFLRENKISFNREEDLKELLKFCDQLQENG